MGGSNRKRRARIESQPLAEPNPIPNPLVDREQWLDKVCNEFISPSPANRGYYRVVLQCLWPRNHGIPGPIVPEGDIRRAIDAYRGAPYHDPFRRVRESQGEEGFLGIHKSGNKYQLVDLAVGRKKLPRRHLNGRNWNTVLKKYDNTCAVCGCSQSEDGCQQDHKIPRGRGGSDEIENWQPLCGTCNSMKSAACRACKEDCAKCCWAFPEKYKPLRIDGEVVARFREYANRISKDPEALIAEMIEKELSR